ncbi:unnamed protein product, partial [Linum tenue]
EIVVLEVSGEDSLGEIERVDDEEAVVGFPPGDESVRRWVVDHLIRLHNERRDGVGAGFAVPAVVPFHPINAFAVVVGGGLLLCFLLSFVSFQGRESRVKGTRRLS